MNKSVSNMLKKQQKNRQIAAEISSMMWNDFLVKEFKIKDISEYKISYDWDVILPGKIHNIEIKDFKLTKD